MELMALKIHNVRDVVKMWMICAECLTDLRCRKTGERVIKDDWEWAADRLACPECDGGDVLVMAKEPIRRAWGDE